jgi:FlaA1/EpsC-like NDP-sugar epimerase
MNFLALNPHRLGLLVTGRATELFADDLRNSHQELLTRIAGRRVLAIGAAGSLGSATIRELVAYGPRAVHVVDQSENSLAELVRDLRSGRASFNVQDFRALPLDYGAPAMRTFLRDNGPYDLVLNFAALKHVRTEKDLYSLIQLLDTNLVKQARFMRWMEDLGYSGRYFCVSTDKAANPVNLMGASKRMMEHFIFSRAIAPRWTGDVVSTRFANVAFSDGSLLDGWLRRLQKGQPLAAPLGTRRYFVSLREAGQICLLAAVLGPAGHLLVPRLDETTDLQDLDVLAEKVLKRVGLTARRYDSEAEAKARLADDLAVGAYPLLVTSLDTAGEKAYEEFVGEGETTIDVGFQALEAIPYVPCDYQALLQFIERVEALVRGERTESKDQIVRWIVDIVPNFNPVVADKTLDDRM